MLKLANKLQAEMIFVDSYLVIRMTSKRYINVKTPRVMPWSREAPVPLPRKREFEKECCRTFNFKRIIFFLII